MAATAMGDRRKLSAWISGLACVGAFCLGAFFVARPTSPNGTRLEEAHDPRVEEAHAPRATSSLARHLDALPVDASSSGSQDLNSGCEAFERDVDEIQLHVLGWRRVEPFRALLRQLEASDYGGWDIPVPLFIHMDGGSNDEATSIADEFNWTHGEKHVHRRDENIGLRGMWLESLGSAAKEAGDNTLMLTFEDDTAVSTAYFQWILAVVDEYARNPRCRDSNLMGFSLSPVRVQELTKPFRRWNGADELGTSKTAFLSVLPSSWGAAFWSDRWKEFSAFAEVRTRPEYYDAKAERVGMAAAEDVQLTPEVLYVPNARSNVWPNSWKRFMVDWMYARGLLMLYPNLPNERGLATTLALTGEHVHVQEPSPSGFVNPRVASLVDHNDLEATRRALPAYAELEVRDLFLEPSTREGVASAGARFVADVRARCDFCDELLAVWARRWACSGGDDEEEDSFENRVCEDLAPICAPDLYMPASWTAQPAQLSSSSERYLLFEPQGGGDNQLIAILQARDLAKALGRTLVLPPVFLPRVSEFKTIEDVASWPDTNTVLRVLDTDMIPGRYSPPVGYKQWWLERNVSASRTLRVGRDPLFDSHTRVLADSALMQAERPVPVPTVDIRHLLSEEATTVEGVKHLFGGCRDQVLAFDQMYFVHLDVGGEIGAVRDKKMVKWANSVDFSPHAAEALSTLKAALRQHFGDRKYACYHVRLGDFLPMCETLKDQGLSPHYAKLLEEGFKCHVTPEEAKDEMDSRPSLPAIVMSDDTDAIEAILTNQDDVVTSSWVKRIIEQVVPQETNKAERELMSLLFEEELCAESEVAVLNKFSTVSDRIASLRSARGKTSSYFKDDNVPSSRSQLRRLRSWDKGNIFARSPSSGRTSVSVNLHERDRVNLFDLAAMSIGG